MPLSKCAVCDSKKSRFIEEQEASRLLRGLGIKTLSSKIPLLISLLFQEYKMSEIVIKFLFSGERFVPEMHLRQPGFRYSTYSIKNKKAKKEYKNLKKQEIQDIFIKTN